MGGKLTDTAPRKSTTVGSASYVNHVQASDTLQEFIFHGGVTIGRGLPFNFDKFEYVACTIKASDDVVVVHQGTTENLYDQSMFTSGDSDSSFPSLIVFTGKGKVTLTPTSFGRPFESSVLAPFANVETVGLAYVNGLVVSKSFDGGDTALHARASVSLGSCSPESEWHKKGECAAWAEDNSSSDCVDKWTSKAKQKKCQRYQRKNKCFKDSRIGRLAQKKCRKTCGLC